MSQPLNPNDQMNHIKLPTDDTLWRALTEVNDPEFPISVVDMGLVRTISREAGRVRVEITFTAMGCPAMEMILQDVRERLLQEKDVNEVEFAVVWNPPWKKDHLSEEGKRRLKKMGIGV